MNAWKCVFFIKAALLITSRWHCLMIFFMISRWLYHDIQSLHDIDSSFFISISSKVKSLYFFIEKKRKIQSIFLMQRKKFNAWFLYCLKRRNFFFERVAFSFFLHISSTRNINLKMNHYEQCYKINSVDITS